MVAAHHADIHPCTVICMENDGNSWVMTEADPSLRQIPKQDTSLVRLYQDQFNRQVKKGIGTSLTGHGGSSVIFVGFPCTDFPPRLKALWEAPRPEPKDHAEVRKLNLSM